MASRVQFTWAGSADPEVLSGIATFRLISGNTYKDTAIPFHSFEDAFAVNQLLLDLQRYSIDDGMESIAHVVKNAMRNVQIK